tara:strand:+ start:876 stop:1577 length:702 start_codon:yes stop_codon:yes gene_type:complete
MITILVPIYKEKDNILNFVNKIDKILKNIDHKVLFVDDNSNDGSINEINKIKEKNRNISYILRNERDRDFTKSCLLGLDRINTKFVCLTDCDLQHDVNKLPEMINIIDSKNYDLLIGSRFIDKNTIIELDKSRYFQSKVGNLLCKIIGIDNVSDPLSGFFIIKTDLFKKLKSSINSSGFKILVSLLFNLKKDFKIIEIKTDFFRRRKGKSKLKLKIYFFFIKQIFSLMIKRFF